MNDLIVSFSIEIQDLSVTGPAGAEQSKASARGNLDRTLPRSADIKPQDSREDFSSPFDESTLYFKITKL